MLDMTPATVAERTALKINPAKTCQPVGAVYAALGVHGCLPHSHGSQGCCAYHRSHLTRHFKEPVMASTSSFTEGSSVFGGMANLTQAFGTIFEMYDPDIVAVHTTCLSEVIGDDIPTIISKATEEGKIPEGKLVVHCNTPSFVGSHVTGFSAMVAGFVKYLSVNTGTRSAAVNILPGWVEPSDMTELKRIVAAFGLPMVMLPDTSSVLDAPATGEHAFFPKGGTTIPDIKAMGDARATLSLGTWASSDAARLLETRCGVPFEDLDLPIGLAATDRFILSLKALTGVDVPVQIEDERGRLVDVISDMHQYLSGRKVAIYGDPDHVIALTEFCRDMDMLPVHVLTGSVGNAFETRIHDILADSVPNANVKAQGDLFLLHQWIKNEPVDLLLGTTYGKFIGRAEDIPLVRVGWPILDRVGHSYFPTVGYLGSLRLAAEIISAIQERQDRDAPDHAFELVL
jgi:nitrogenase molybdenum-iron protein beta chain